MKKLVIWDFDGVISDTEGFLFSVWSKHIKQNKNKEISRDYWNNNLVGLNSQDICLNLLDEFYFGVDADKVNKECVEELKDNKSLHLTNGIEYIFDKIPHQCIATNSSLSSTLLKMDNLNINKYFDKDTIFTSEMVSRGKPSPDLFLYTAEKMGFDPKDCIMIEDSVSCAKTAKDIGMDVIVFMEHTTYKKEKDLKFLERYDINKIAYDTKGLNNLLFPKFQNLKYLGR